MFNVMCPSVLEDHSLDFICRYLATELDGFRNPNFISCVFQDTGVMDLIDNVIFHPVTIFLPSDDVMASLPQQQKDFLFHQQNRAQLQEYLKYHVMISQKVRHSAACWPVVPNPTAANRFRSVDQLVPGHNKIATP